MFCFQSNYFHQTEPMTPERFTQLYISDDVVGRIKAYRQHLPELDRLKQEVKDREALIAASPDPKASTNADLKAEISQRKKQMQAITTLKTGLPVLMYQAASFDETKSKNGNLGRWRSQRAVRLNGLFMLDVDHVDNPRELFLKWCALPPKFLLRQASQASPGAERGGLVSERSTIRTSV